MLAGMLAANADSTRDETLRQVGHRARPRAGRGARDGRRQPVRAALGQGTESENLRRRRGRRKKARRRRCAAPGPTRCSRRTRSPAIGWRSRCSVRTWCSSWTSRPRTSGEDIAIEQVRVSEASRMVAKSLREMQLGREFGVIVMAIRTGDGQMMFNPDRRYDGRRRAST